MTIPFIPSSRPISTQTFVNASGDDTDERTIGENDSCKRESGQDQDKQDVAPDPEELKKKPVVSGQDEFPDGGLRAWMVVLGGACVTFGTFGFVNAWGVFQAYYQQTVLSDTSPSTIAWIGSVQYALVFLPGLVTGRLFDLGHYRIPQLFAAALLIIGTFLAAECHEYWQFLLCQGIAIGLASGFLFGPTIAVVSHWFRARRGLALGVLASGSSIGGTVIPIAVRKLIPIVGFKWAMRIIGFILLFVLSIAILTLRRRLPPKKVSGGLLNLKAFLHIPYTIYVLASVVSFLGLYTVLTYLEVYGTEIGLPEDFAFYMIPIANAASLFGRIGSGVVSDRIGPINTLIPSTLVAGVCTYAWPFARNKGSLVALACIYGTACGVFVGMLATPVAKMGSMDDVGRRTGMLMTVIAGGAVAGPPISGAIRDTTGSFVDVGYYAGSMIILCVLLLICVKFVALGTLRGKF
ncbi:putative transporter MCH4 [Saccharomyces cerevisiae S288c] [Rhizoctonia solani]|uniref:Putative transporter MCH4 [Saccharomyces cerevisiae S288c] n=1 Tax=Rhizoctonia solani TaxID=456999 RepID=A0A0K6FSS7_9AGAM|nr:putative transporter MCH4 [Saccharomyces cerevisiae S288c] [Rhizoctonia solani]